MSARGFEAWRLLTQRYSPTGGQYELDAMLALVQRKPARDAVALPGAISKLERDIALYVERTGRTFPEEWRVPTLIQLLPKTQAETLKLRYAEGLTDYKQIVSNILTFSQTMRFEGAYGRGDNDMDIGMMDFDDLTASQLNVFWEAVVAGSMGEDPPPAPHDENGEAFIDGLQRKGKNKGKGKWRGTSAAYSQGSQGKGPDQA